MAQRLLSWSVVIHSKHLQLSPVYRPPVYPNVCSMKVVAVSDRSERESRVDFWDDVYGGSLALAVMRGLSH